MPQLVRDQVFFLHEIQRHGGVVLAVDVDAGVEFLHLFVGKQLRKRSEELCNFWVLVQGLGGSIWSGVMACMGRGNMKEGRRTI